MKKVLFVLTAVAALTVATRYMTVQAQENVAETEVMAETVADEVANELNLVNESLNEVIDEAINEEGMSEEFLNETGSGSLEAVQ